MAYLVLARKYRPARFADMIGQEHVTRTLANAIREDRVHHAYLFCGVRGLGKTTAARILAKCLVCREGPTATPCDHCDQCVAVTEGRSVDVIEIDGASHNSVDDIRSLREQVYYLPQSARRKIYIIDEVHMLSQQAFNALLKTLEEPPAHVTFLFATTDPHKVLPTILSRVSRLDFRRVRAAELVPHLESILEREGISCEREGLHVVARCGEGSVRDALTLLDKVISFAHDSTKVTTAEILELLGETDRFAIAALAEAVLAGDGRRTLEHFQRICAAGGDLQRFALAFLQHLRDLYVVKLGGQRDLVIEASDDLYDQLRAQAHTVDLAVLAQHFDRFTRVVDDLDRSRVPRLVIEMGLLELAHAQPLLPIGELIARLESIEAGVAPSSRGGGGSASPGGPGPGSAVRVPRGSPGSRQGLATSSESRFAGESTLAGAHAGSVDTSATPAAAGGESGIVDQLWSIVRRDRSWPRSREEPSPTPPADASPHPLPRVPAAATAPVTTTPPVARPTAPIHDSSSSFASTPPIPGWRALAPFPAWEALLMRVRDQDELLFAVLAEVGLARLDAQVLELASPADSFAGRQLRGQPELLASLRCFVETSFGELLPTRLVDAHPALPEFPSLALVERERRRELEESVAREVLGDPHISALVRTFGARIGRVDPLAEVNTSGTRAQPPAARS